MRKVLNTIERVAMFLAIACAMIMICIVVWQVYTRTFLPRAPAWTEELARMLYVHVVGFAAPIALRKDRLMAVDIIFEMLSPRGKIIQRLFSRVIVLVFSVIFAYLAYGFFMIGFRELTVALQWSMAIPFASMLICGVLCVIYSVETTIKDFKSVITKGELSS